MTDATVPCTARHINHVCIAVRDIEASLSFYARIFGTRGGEAVDIADQGVRAALVRVGGSQLERRTPTTATSTPKARNAERARLG